MPTPTPLELPRITVERVRLPVQTSTDPTGDVPEWATAPAGAVPDEGDWIAGTWEGSWSAGGWLDAVSPTLVGAAAEVPLPVGRWLVWFRFAIGSEVPARIVGYVDVT